MLKLYKTTDTGKHYWETWENDSIHTVHWGRLGTKGQSKELKTTAEIKAESVIQKEMDGLLVDGFDELDPDDEATLMIEFAVEGMGGSADLDKRHRLQERMDEILGWTGLGHCDGGSIGSGTMEVCCFVADFQIAKAVVEKDLAGTEFENFTRIYDENEDC